MKYDKEYSDCKENKELFIKLILERYKNIKPSTALRRWYDYKNKKLELPEEAVEKTYKYPDEFKEKPSYMKMINFNDMKQMNKPFKERRFLARYGFTEYEINWLEDEGLLI